MNEKIKDLIEQLNVCSVNDYNFEIYGNEAKILNEYITSLQQENARLKDKIEKGLEELNKTDYEYSSRTEYANIIMNTKEILKEN